MTEYVLEDINGRPQIRPLRDDEDRRELIPLPDGQVQWITPEARRALCASTLERNPHPSWRDDPSYDWRRKR